MAEEIGNLIVKVEADVKSLKSSMKTAQNEISSFSDNSKKNLLDFKNITEVALGVSFANLTTKAIESIVSFSTNTIKNTIKTNEAFEMLKLQVGDTADSLLTDMRKASKGMINDFNLISSANKAMALGIKQSDIAGLLEVATSRAKLLGIETSKAFEDITTGVGRNSKMILDNLGIIVNLDSANQKYAKSVGKTVEQLTDQEKKQAMVNEIMTKSKPLIDAMALSNDNLSTSYEKIKVDIENLGTKIVNGILHLDKYSEAVQGIKTSWDIMTESVGDKIIDVKALDNFKQLGSIAKENQKNIDELTRATTNAKKEFENLFTAPFEGKSKLDSQISQVDVWLAEVSKQEAEINKQKLDGQVVDNDVILALEERRTKLEAERDLLTASRDLELSRIENLKMQGKYELEKLVPEEKSLNYMKDSVNTFIENTKSQLKMLENSKLLQKSYEDEARELQGKTKELTQQEYIKRKLLLLQTATNMLTGGSTLEKVRQAVSSKDIFNTIEKTARISETETPRTNTNTSNSVNNVINIQNFSAVNPEESANILYQMLNTKVR